MRQMLTWQLKTNQTELLKLLKVFQNWGMKCYNDEKNVLVGNLRGRVPPPPNDQFGELLKTPKANFKTIKIPETFLPQRNFFAIFFPGKISDALSVIPNQPKRFIS